LPLHHRSTPNDTDPWPPFFNDTTYTSTLIHATPPSPSSPSIVPPQLRPLHCIACFLIVSCVHSSSCSYCFVHSLRSCACLLLICSRGLPVPASRPCHVACIAARLRTAVCTNARHHRCILSRVSSQAHPDISLPTTAARTMDRCANNGRLMHTHRGRTQITPKPQNPKTPSSLLLNY
jgi:hypothetical protein